MFAQRNRIASPVSVMTRDDACGVPGWLALHRGQRIGRRVSPAGPTGTVTTHQPPGSREPTPERVGEEDKDNQVASEVRVLEKGWCRNHFGDFFGAILSKPSQWSAVTIMENGPRLLA